VELGIKLHGPTWCDVNSPAGICINPNSCIDKGYATTYKTICDNLGTTYGFATNTHPIYTTSATNGFTEKVVVSDNKLIGAGSPYLMVAGPQNSVSDERLKDIIIERNLFQAGGSATQDAMVIHSADTTFRNNLCNMTGGSTGTVCVQVTPYSQTSPAPITDNVRVYNNTTYNADATAESYGVRIDPQVSNATIINNLLYAPSAITTKLLYDSGCGSGCFTSSNNSSDYDVKHTSPLFAATPPVLITDWKLQTGSYSFTIVGTPIPAPVWSDFFRADRPASGSVHMGATEQ
jgi:hypothetical protein